MNTPNRLSKQNRRTLILCLCVLLSFVFFASVNAEQITAIDLGIHDLTLKAGESYTFDVKYEPEIPQYYTLNWFVTDDSVIEIDGPNFTVKALKNGEADILAESFDGVSYDTCHVTVGSSQPKDGSTSTSGESFITLSEKDRSKISSRSINRFLNFLEGVKINAENSTGIVDVTIFAAAVVKPGTEEAESKRAYDLGMEEAIPLKMIHVVTLQGTLSQILQFVDENDALVDIVEWETVSFPDPEPETAAGSKSKNSMNLGGNTEALTIVSAAHNNGFDGSCSTIAIIDSGIDNKHEQFTGRIIHEACFSRPDKTTKGTGTYINPCVSEDSAEPGNAINAANFNHGTHVAGIAAGRNGIAPKANIIAIQMGTQVTWPCAKKDLPDKACPGSTTMCCDSHIFTNDILRAYDHILQLADQGVEITAVNMSYGSGAYSSACDVADKSNILKFNIFGLFEKYNIIPVAASGNQGSYDQISSPACLSNVVAVGALADTPDPLLWYKSNHNQLIDITAPGENIYSSIYAKTCPEGKNCYDKKSGTSMAAPMVTGAYALLRQAYPDMPAKDLKALLISMSNKTVNLRTIGNVLMPIDEKPVLDFRGFSDLKPARWFCPVIPILPHTGFSTKAETVLRQQPQNISYAPTGLRIQIPALSVESEILTVPYVENDYPVEWLKDSVGLLEGSAKPGEGVVVLTGHNHIDNTQAGPFVAIGSLNEGDKIMLRDERGKLYTYTVFANELIKNDDIEAFEKLVNKSANSITLLTCEEELLEGGYAYRRVISAGFDKLMN